MRCVRMPYDDCYHLVNNKRETKSKSKSKIHNNGFCCCIVTTRYVHCNRLQFCFGCKLEKPNPTENKTERQSCMDFCCDFFELIFSFLSLSLSVSVCFVLIICVCMFVCVPQCTVVVVASTLCMCGFENCKCSWDCWCRKYVVFH